MRRFAAAILWSLAMMTVVAWALGCALNDRWGWSQWLWWIPAPVALAASLLALGAGAFARAGRGRTVRLALAAAAIAASIGAISHSVGLASRASTPTALHMLFWNARWPGEAAPRSAQALARWSGRVMVIANPGRLRPESAAWMQPGDAAAEAGTFLVTGPVRFLEARPVVQGDDGFAAFFKFVAPGVGETTMLAVDLPSDPARPRAASLARFAAQLRSAVDVGRVDLVLGDFNCTRGSASVAAAFPGFADAWDTAGMGWGASFPREWPLLHIDLVLAGARIAVERAEVHDPGVGFHRLTAVSIRRASDR